MFAISAMSYSVVLTYVFLVYASSLVAAFVVGLPKTMQTICSKMPLVTVINWQELMRGFKYIRYIMCGEITRVGGSWVKQRATQKWSLGSSSF